jgi:hypothetical protein
MTHDEENRVLNWLRRRPRNPHDGLPERRCLQRALGLGEPLSRDIRNAMADWLEEDPDSLLLNRAALRDVFKPASAAPNDPYAQGPWDEVRAVAEHNRRTKPSPASQADPQAQRTDRA